MIPVEILVIEDDPLLSKILVDALQRMGYSARHANSLADARLLLQKIEPLLTITDARLPDGDSIDMLPNLQEICPVIMMTAYGSVRDAVAAMKAGAMEYLLKPINLDELEMVVRRALDTRTLQEDFKFYKRQCKRRDRHHKLMVGDSTPLHQVEDMIRAVAPTDVSVLIQGESGTGKELVATELHKLSQRGKRHFVALDCCTLQEKLFESELFGHERGAFTGADKQKKGLIESAAGGTLFLDEIGEIDPIIQAKLLRVLETGQFRRLGGVKDLYADVRIVAATNRDLEQMSKEGGFRNDLYYRLSTFIITLPPLRQRLEDIPALARHFIANHSFSRRIDKQLNPAARQHLMNYAWPGNIRELRNVMERAIILSGESAHITPEHLAFCSSSQHDKPGVQLNFSNEPNLEQIERDYFHLLMKKYAGHRATIAKILGVSERHVYRMLKKYDAA